MVLKRLCVQALRLNGGYPRGSRRWAAARGLSSTPGSSAVEARTVAERTVGEPLVAEKGSPEQDRELLSAWKKHVLVAGGKTWQQS